MVDEIKTHIIGITESWANNDITDAKLGMEGYVMFRKDRTGRRGGGVLLYMKETIPAYEVQIQEEADCKEVIWCKLVTGHTTVTIGVVYRCPNITKENNEKIHNNNNNNNNGRNGSFYRGWLPHRGKAQMACNYRFPTRTMF